MASEDDKKKKKGIGHKIARELNREAKGKTLGKKPAEPEKTEQTEMAPVVDGAAPPPVETSPSIPGAPLPTVQFGQARDYILLQRACNLLKKRLGKLADENASDQYIKEANIIRADIESITTQILPKLGVQGSLPFPDDDDPDRVIETVIRPIVVKLKNPKVKLTETEAVKMLVSKIAAYGIECAEKGYHMGNQARQMTPGRIAVLASSTLRDSSEGKPANV